MPSQDRILTERGNPAPGETPVGDTDVVSRQVKAEKVAHILADAWPEHLAESRCLDLGCGIGVISAHIAQFVREVVALDPEWSLLCHPSLTGGKLQGDGLQLPFRSEAFDIVVCAQVYEHVTNPAQLASEITRIIRPGGICYFSGPNRLWPYERHYQAWFVHWLPMRWHHRLLRLLGRNHPPRVTLLNYWQLRRLWSHFALHDYTTALVRDPDRLPGANAPRWMRHMPLWALELVAFLTPSVNWILMKPLSEGEA